jgi:hypothetical protein
LLAQSLVASEEYVYPKSDIQKALSCQSAPMNVRAFSQQLIERELSCQLLRTIGID